MIWALCLALSVLTACAGRASSRPAHDELMFLRSGVDLDEEEREVRRVLAQRDLRVVARIARPALIALGAASRDGRRSAVRVITPRGTVIAEDGAADDLFVPSRVTLLEHVSGNLDVYEFVATARIPGQREVGCVTLHRILPDGTAVDAVLDVGALGSRACVSNLADGGEGKLRAKVAWPGLHVLATPQLDVELRFTQALVGRAAPLVPVAKLDDTGDWLDEARGRLSVVRLARAPFSDRHVTGVARAALARLAGQSLESQVGAYRAAIHRVLPNSAEAEAVAATVSHMERGWEDPQPAPPVDEDDASPARPDAAGEGALPAAVETDEAVVIEPDQVEPLP